MPSGSVARNGEFWLAKPLAAGGDPARAVASLAVLGRSAALAALNRTSWAPTTIACPYCGLCHRDYRDLDAVGSIFGRKFTTSREIARRRSRKIVIIRTFLPVARPERPFQGSETPGGQSLTDASQNYAPRSRTASAREALRPPRKLLREGCPTGAAPQDHNSGLSAWAECAGSSRHAVQILEASPRIRDTRQHSGSTTSIREPRPPCEKTGTDR
jgi:hypothetical protein